MSYHYGYTAGSLPYMYVLSTRTMILVTDKQCIVIYE